jgi:hypothetical protein
MEFVMDRIVIWSACCEFLRWDPVLMCVPKSGDTLCLEKGYRFRRAAPFISKLTGLLFTRDADEPFPSWTPSLTSLLTRRTTQWPISANGSARILKHVLRAHTGCGTARTSIYLTQEHDAGFLDHEREGSENNVTWFGESKAAFQNWSS